MSLFKNSKFILIFFVSILITSVSFAQSEKTTEINTVKKVEITKNAKKCEYSKAKADIKECSVGKEACEAARKSQASKSGCTKENCSEAKAKFSKAKEVKEIKITKAINKKHECSDKCDNKNCEARS